MAKPDQNETLLWRSKWKNTDELGWQFWVGGSFAFICFCLLLFASICFYLFRGAELHCCLVPEELVGDRARAACDFSSHQKRELTEHNWTKNGLFLDHGFPNGTNVCFDGFLWFSPSACLPICLRPGGRGGQKQIGRQVEGFSLFGCAAVGARGIQYE